MNRAQTYFPGALFTGVVIGALITLDPWLMVIAGLRVPMLVAGLVLLSLLFLTVFFQAYPRLHAHRDRVFLFLLFLSFHVTSIGVGIDIGEVMIALIILLTLLEALSRNNRKFIITPFFFIVALFYIIIIASLAKAFDPFTIRKEIKAVVVFFLIFTYLYWQNSHEWAVKVLIGLTTFSCLLAIFQEGYYVATGDLLVGFISQDSLNRMFEETPLIPFGRVFRTPALTNGYRELAILLTLSIALLLGRMLDANERKNRRNYILLALHICGILLCLTKDLMIGLLLGTALILLYVRPRRIVWYAAIAAIGGSALLLVLAYIPGGPETFSDFVYGIPSIERERMQLDRDGIEGFLQRGEYLLGAGVAGASSFTDHYLNWEAHNAFILVMDAAGFLGLISLMTVYGWIGYRVWQINSIATTRSDIILAYGFGIFYIAVLFGAQFTADFTEIVFWLYAAMVESTAVRLLKPEYDARLGL